MTKRVRKHRSPTNKRLIIMSPPFHAMLAERITDIDFFEFRCCAAANKKKANSTYENLFHLIYTLERLAFFMELTF